MVPSFSLKADRVKLLLSGCLIKRCGKAGFFARCGVLFHDVVFYRLVDRLVEAGDQFLCFIKFLFLRERPDLFRHYSHFIE